MNNDDGINFTDDLIRAEIARRMNRPVRGTMTIRDNRTWERPPVPPEAQMIDTPATGDIAVIGTASTPEILFDLRPVKLQWGEFLMHHTAADAANKFMGEFKTLLRGLAGNATALTLDSRQVATFRRDGRLNLTRLKAEQPDLVARYTRIVAKEQFDEDAFRREMPDVHAAYRGESLRLVDRPITA